MQAFFPCAVRDGANIQTVPVNDVVRRCGVAHDDDDRATFFHAKKWPWNLAVISDSAHRDALANVECGRLDPEGIVSFVDGAEKARGMADGVRDDRRAVAPIS